MDDNVPSLLVLLIDSKNMSWKNQEKQKSEIKMTFDDYIKSILLYCNAYTLLHNQNRLIVINRGSTDTSVVFPSKKSESSSQFSNVDKDECIPTPHTLMESILNYFQENHESTVRNDVSAVSKSTCTLASGLSKALCAINRQLLQTPNLQPRILVTQICRDKPTSYNHIMNCIFSAQKLNVVIDSLILSYEDSTFLQQASLMTNGIYLKPHDQRSILQLLFTHYLVSPHLRKTALLVPIQKTIDFRASCFCHQKPVEFAYMCSVCLAITCDIIDPTKCITCETATIKSFKKQKYS